MYNSCRLVREFVAAIESSEGVLSQGDFNNTFANIREMTSCSAIHRFTDAWCMCVYVCVHACRTLFFILTLIFVTEIFALVEKKKCCEI